MHKNPCHDLLYYIRYSELECINNAQRHMYTYINIKTVRSAARRERQDLRPVRMAELLRMGARVGWVGDC